MVQHLTAAAIVAAAAGASLATWAEGGAFAVYPPAFSITASNDTQRLVAVATRADGVTIDVTAEAAVAFEPEGVAAWDPAAGVVKPVADGETTVVVRHGEAEQRIALKVSNAAVTPAISFRNDVEPVLMRAGCNSGGCHGSAQGKNGFRLSLFGFDPEMDYVNLTRETWARRINVALPDESLMLMKAAGGVDHEGGSLFDPEHKQYEIVKRWIAEGALDDPAELPELTGIEIMPPAVVLEGADAKHRFVVLATYSDGTDRDVTDMAILASGDDLSIALSPEGVATSGQRGEAYVMARYGTFAVVSKTIVVPGDMQLAWPDTAPKNFVDELVFAKLKKLRVPPAESCSDEVFVRRVHIDILGALPTVEETRAFLEDGDPDKRAKLVDRLIERPEFTQLWTMKWAEALQVRQLLNGDSRKAMHRYNDWLRESIASNKPVDDLVRELLSAEGGNFTSPATNFYLLEDQPAMIAENVAQVFFGIQLQCAQCHNHPFERWTMDDYYSFAAFFAQVGRKTSSDPRETIVFNRGGGEVKNLKNDQVMAPKFLGGATPDVAGKDRRAVLAEWMTGPDNPWFAENIANRVWDHFFGKGIIDPPDDVRVTNPPTNPELLAEMGKQLAAADYDLRSLVRSICTSHTYQMATQPLVPELRDERNFALATVRRLPAEQLLDAISAVTDTSVKFSAVPAGGSAIEVADGRTGNYFLDVFGRPARESACTCERSNEPTLAQALHLINGDTVDRAVKDGNGRLAKRLAEEVPPAQIIEELYLAAYSRKPSEAELTQLTQFVDAAADKKVALEDIYWSVLNSKEFIFTH